MSEVPKQETLVPGMKSRRGGENVRRRADGHNEGARPNQAHTNGGIGERMIRTNMRHRGKINNGTVGNSRAEQARMIAQNGG